MFTCRLRKEKLDSGAQQCQAKLQQDVKSENTALALSAVVLVNVE